MTSLGIVAALPHEVRCFKAAPRSTREPVELVPDVWLCISGVGPERARETAELLLDRGVRGLVSWGSAGGLDPELAPGSLVLATDVLAGDGQRFAVDADWRRRVEQRLAGSVAVNAG